MFELLVLGILLFLTLSHLKQSSGCLGCYTKPELNTPEKKTLRDFRVKGHSARKPSLSEDYWTTSMCDMDNSISSISTNNQVLDAHGGTGITNAPSEFVNHGKFSLHLSNK